MNFTPEQQEYYQFISLIGGDIQSSLSDEQLQKYDNFNKYRKSKCVNLPLKKAFKKWIMYLQILDEQQQQDSSAEETEKPPYQKKQNHYSTYQTVQHHNNNNPSTQHLSKQILNPSPQQTSNPMQTPSPIRQTVAALSEPWNFEMTEFGRDFNLLSNNISPAKIPMVIETQPVTQVLTQLPQPHVGKKDMSKLKEMHKKRKRKESNNNSNKRTAGRPTRFETLTKIVGEQNDPIMFSQALVLLGSDRSIKKSRPVLTKYNHDIECYTEKDFTAYDYITEERKKALETIKKEQEKLTRLDTIEELLKLEPVNETQSVNKQQKTIY
jgi:hypothetical protein